ncbi:hypothetical protein KY290_002748 [Solanum tuberosum]|uniref:Uncharacterized protein n=1 Tax=Solanum tuberosum TaxID=4113 RepID=A0ABQ7WT58_SOLTU|nr:hypothetical protein KY290_002748 [Solanum tuberosum]
MGASLLSFKNQSWVTPKQQKKGFEESVRQPLRPSQAPLLELRTIIYCAMTTTAMGAVNHALV